MPINLDDYTSSDDPSRTDYFDFNEELADEIDKLVVNDSWRSNTSQRYYVTTVVEETLDRLPRSQSQRRRRLPEVRTEVQADVADDVGIDKRSVQAHCHAELFKGYENPPQDFRSKSQWVELFDQLIQEIDRTWYQNRDS